MVEMPPPLLLVSSVRPLGDVVGTHDLGKSEGWREIVSSAPVAPDDLVICARIAWSEIVPKPQYYHAGGCYV